MCRFCLLISRPTVILCSLFKVRYVIGWITWHSSRPLLRATFKVILLHTSRIFVNVFVSPQNRTKVLPGRESSTLLLDPLVEALLTFIGASERISRTFFTLCFCKVSLFLFHPFSLLVMQKSCCQWKVSFSPQKVEKQKQRFDEKSITCKKRLFWTQTFTKKIYSKPI